MKKETLEVGDKIKVKNIFATFTVEIVRVTKTKAIGLWNSDPNTTHQFNFKRKCLYGIKGFSPIKYDTTDYTLL